jgi:hypothetical protein
MMTTLGETCNEKFKNDQLLISFNKLKIVARKSVELTISEKVQKDATI